jgi:2-keto-4-pentenoate hydratase
MARLPPVVALQQEALLERWRAELAAGASRVGWKIGHDIPEVTAHSGHCPVVGYLTSWTAIEDGGAWSRQGSDLRAEAEFAVSIGADLHANDAASVPVQAIAGLCAALEIVDVDRPPGDLDAVMGSDVFHRAVAFGPTRSVTPDELGHATLHLNDTVHYASEPMPDPLWVVRTAAEILAQFGERLLTGDRILSGSFIHQRLGHARLASVAIRGLGRVSLAIT